MKVKEIDRTANVVWSPSNQHPAFLAAGTPAQQLDASFSTLANLELYMLDLTDSALEMPLSGSIDTEERCCKLVWGSLSLTPDATEIGGLIVAGTDNGNVCVYNPQKILHQRGGSCEQSLVISKQNHVGKVQALAFNNFQKNLLATGAGDSDIFIWDLNQMETPMTPGTKSQPSEDVQSLAWNHKVQHILGSTFANRCVVWDLRKSDPVIKLSDSMTKMKCKEICWHPEVATRLCLSSEDDHTPFIQLWDLRYATSPVHSLERHTKGVNSVAWCPRDPDLLLSCGKDNLLYCWNPNSTMRQGELVYEMRLEQEWAFDVSWCPRNPALVSAASFDGRVSLYSVMGGRGSVSRGPPKRVVDSFPADQDDPFSQVGNTAYQPEESEGQILDDSPALQKAPRWLKKPCGARFAFGGKLVTFSPPNTSSSLFGGSTSDDTDHGSQRKHRHVLISQITTEQELVDRATLLDNVVEQSSMEVLEKFCEEKVTTAGDVAGSIERQMWSFLRAHFEEDTRSAFMDLLGFGDELVNRKIKTAMIIGKENHSQASKLDSEYAESLSLEGGDDSAGDVSKGSEEIEYDEFDQINSRQNGSRMDYIRSDDEGMGLGSQLQLSVVEDGVDSALSIALLSGHLDRAVELCLRDDRAGEAIILAVASGSEELYRKTQSFVLSKLHTDSARLIQTVVTRDWQRMMEHCAIENWKEALACALTYSNNEEFVTLCEHLGERLETERNGELALHACICYICCGNIEKLVRAWQNSLPTTSPRDLQSLMELIVILRKALDDEGTRDPAAHCTSQLFNRYANLLAAQGRLATALHYLGNETEPNLMLLKDRIYRGLDEHPPTVQPPPCPFQIQQVASPQQHRPAQTSGNVYHDRSRTISNSSSHQQQPAYFQPVTSQQPPTMFQPQSQPTSRAPPPVSSAAVSQRSVPQYPSSAMPPPPAVGQPYFNPASSQPSRLPPPPSMPGKQQPSSHSPAANLPPPPPSGAVQKIGHNTGPGWNDPPIVSQSYKPAAPVEPVINNFYNPAAFMPDNSAPPPGFQPGRNPNPAVAPNPMMPPQSMRPSPAFQPSSSPAPQVGATTSRAPPNGDSAPHSAKDKLPVEYKVMEEALAALVNACRQASPSNRQLKMKMDDVDKKLECLYVELSRGSLSPAVLAGLHDMVNAVQQGDYSSAAAHVNAIIQQANFAEVRPFITGLKVLMQSAEKSLLYSR